MYEIDKTENDNESHGSNDNNDDDAESVFDAFDNHQIDFTHSGNLPHCYQFEFDENEIDP